MVCKNCGKEFEGSFCPDCGTAVEDIQDTQQMTSCPNCGAERVGEGKFCVACGYNYEEPTQSAQPTQERGTKNAKSSGKGLKVLSKLYRWLLAGGMILVGIISLLCLTAPVITENFLGESEALCTGFEAISGKDSSIPTAIAGASKMLLVLSILALVYGVVQLILAIKKPYINTIGKKKFVFWGIDGVISVLLIVSGAMMSSQAKSESFMEGKLGSGFAFAIVMGVFALVFLAARIFYELKLFKIEDTGLSEEQVANLTEKKERKKLTKKQIMAIIIPVVTAVVLVAVIVPSVIWANNIFRSGKVDKINIGDSQEQVIKVLGEPYEKSNYRYEYYSDNYLKVLQQLDKIYGNERGLVALASNDDDIDLDDWGDDFGEDNEEKLREQLRTMTYQYICVEFDDDKKVSTVFFDKAKCDSKEDDKKTVKSYKLAIKSIMRYVATDIVYSVKFTDGSFYKAVALSNYVTWSGGEETSIKWSDEWKSDYYIDIKIKDNPDILYAGNDGEVSLLLDKNNVLNVEGNGSVSNNEIRANDKTVKEIHIGSGITGIKMTSNPTPFSYIIANVERITVDENNPVYRAEGNCLISREDNTLVLGCKSSQIPSSVTSIGHFAFYDCTSLTSIMIPSSVTMLDYSVFSGCSKLTSIIVATDNQVYKSDGNCIIEKETNTLILGCNNSVIPNYVTSIGRDAFWRCSGLTSVTIPSSVTSIGDYAFCDCSSLTSVTIPSSVTSIGKCAFLGCIKLTSITLENTNGWYVTKDSDATSGTSVSVTNTSTNVTNLTDTYYNYYWKRNA